MFGGVTKQIWFLGSSSGPDERLRLDPTFLALNMGTFPNTGNPRLPTTIKLIDINWPNPEPAKDFTQQKPVQPFF